MNLFFADTIQYPNALLPEDDSFHCIKVLRLRTDSLIHITDGKGSIYEARIVNEDLKKTSVEITKTIKTIKRERKLSIAIAPVKNINRFEWFLEKAVEIGVDEIIPIICQHSERRTINYQRLNKIIKEALKQSYQAILPELSQQIDFKDFISRVTQNGRYIGLCDERIEKRNLTDVSKDYNDNIVLIGPEGDFSEEEINLAIENKFIPVTISDNRLRTETAGIVSCTIFNL